MKKKLLIGLLTLVVLLTAHLVHADFYIIPVGGGVGKAITSLPYTITSPGFYYLKKNLTTAGTGIIVEANHVTIDLMGFCITGPGSASGYNFGIRIISDISNIEIRNGTIREFAWHAVSGINGGNDDIRVLNIRAYYSGYAGIALAPTRGSRVQGCTAAHNGSRGINVGKGAIVAKNIVHDNGESGIHVDYPGAVITGNNAFDNTLDGIRAARGATVVDNVAHSNTENGFRLAESSTVKNNTAFDNGLYGFDFYGRSTVYNNTAYNNGSGNYDSCTFCTIGENYMP